MNIEISFRNLEHTPALDGLIKKKTEKLQRHFTQSVNITWVCSTEKNEHTSTLIIKDKKTEFFAKSASDSLYKSVDIAIGKVIQQVEHRH
jgi:ribosomal subunit interface protein